MSEHKAKEAKHLRGQREAKERAFFTASIAAVLAAGVTDYYIDADRAAEYVTKAQRIIRAAEDAEGVEREQEDET